MKFVVDSREKKPLRLRRPYVTRALKVGDYSISGWTQAIAIEYKGREDFFSWLYSKRFDSQVEKLLSLELGVIVVGCDLRSKRYSEVTDQAVDHKVSILSSHGLPVIFAGGRTRASSLVVSILEEGVKQLKRR